MFDPRVLYEIQLDAIARYPSEACGLVVEGVGYVPAENVADDPLQAFRMRPEEWTAHGPVIAVAHSHCDVPDVPSSEDMRSQIETARPWILCATNGKDVSKPWWWGAADQEPPPLLGRTFRHGPSGSDGKGDCYALIRDWYRTVRGIVLPEFPRDAEWWRAGGDLYRDGFQAAGFTRVDGDPLPGDVLLGQIRSPVPNHGVVYLGQGLMMHHLEHRLSAREPIGGWRKYLTHVLRHQTAMQ